MRFVIRNIQYHPNDGPISVYYEHDAAEPLIRNFINLKAADVVAPPGQPWGDAEILAAARTAFAAQYPDEAHTLDYPAPGVAA